MAFFDMSLGDQVLVLVIYALAIMRLTRLVNSDTILDPLRIRLADRERQALVLQREAKIAGQNARAAVMARQRQRWQTANYFMGCPWCVSMWAAAGLTWVPLWFPHNPVAWYLAVMLAFTHVAGLGSRLFVPEVVTVEDVNP